MVRSFFRSIWQPLNDVLSSCDAHYWNTGHFPNTLFQRSVVGCHNVNLVLHNAVDNAVICVDTFVVAFEALPSLVSGDSQCNAVLRTQLLKFGHNTVCNDGYTLGIETVHHSWEQVEFPLNAEIDEIGIEEDRVGWD